MMMDTLPRTNEGRFVKGFAYSPETMFQAGQEPQNKGKKFPGTGNRESFAKGHQPHNTLYDGATKIRTTNQGRSYQYIRISKGNWEFMQKHRWTNEVGEIPDGMILRCKTKDTLNCDPSNWIMITKAENARMNRLECDFKIAICTICSNEYETRSRQSKYCSAECRRLGGLVYMEKWHARHPREKKQGPRNVSSKVKICVICENAFFPTSNIQKTCSDGCTTILRYQVREQYKKDHPKEKKTMPEKHCSKCGQKFTPYNNSHTICSACKVKGPRTVTCIECGTEFTKEGRGVQLICSDDCKRKRKSRIRSKYGFVRKPTENKIRNCQVCGTEFEAKRGGKYCSEACKHTAKLAHDQQRREKERSFIKQRVSTEPKTTAYTCMHCHNQFTAVRKTKYCSDKCRAEIKIMHNSKYRPSKKLRESIPQKPLNKRNPKAEKEAVYAMLELNRNAPTNDREIINREKIVSPDLSKMEFRVFDPKLRITRFFKTEERYNNFLNELQK